MEIIVSTDPPEAHSNILSQGIIDYNESAVPDLESVDDEVRFFVLARTGTGSVVGGIRASCYWNTLHIELLWLSEECRGTGIGKQLLDSAENYAAEHHCEKALVETTSWQAKPFYEKNGYQLLATLPDRPKGHASHYLAKNLTIGMP
ncbi:GNAT family N-acetyltransferase [Parasphingorhabdus sp.]